MNDLFVEYNPEANVDDGSCEQEAVLGCVDLIACNYNFIANVDDGSCIYPEGCDYCFEGNIVENDLDQDGVCDIVIDQIISEGFYIPDGTAVPYESVINVTEFDTNTFIDTYNLFEICIDIEHSYLGDLDISLTAPNGTVASLHEYGTGGTSIWLGNALDNNLDETPGECWEYCWSTEPEFGTFANSLGNTMLAPNGSLSMITGSYTPEDEFSNSFNLIFFS